MQSNRLVTAFAVAALVGAPVALVRAQAPGRGRMGPPDVPMANQKQVVDHMIVGDSLEVQMAQLAAARTKSAAVRNFANTLVTDHTNHLAALRKLAGKRDIGRAANPADSSGMRTERMLARMQGVAVDSAFDRGFVSQQIRHHMRALAELNSLRAVAKDDDLQHDIDATRPVLERHLALARSLAAQMGIPADSERGGRGRNGADRRNPPRR